MPQSDLNPDHPEQWVAIDMGSNSFHLLIVELDGSGYTVIERLKEKVQLLAGTSAGDLAEDAKARGIACLKRFAQRIAAVDASRILFMGTFALRQARNAEAFLQDAAQIIGKVPRIISGSEEAELIDAAVAYHEPYAERLVVDIGGGSTELRAQGALSFAHSADVGCVSLREAYLQDVTPALGFASARAHALRLLEAMFENAGLPRETLVRGTAAMHVMGTSGTIESVLAVLEANGWSQGKITRDGLARLELAMVEDQWTWDAGLPGLMLERLDIFPAGVAILSAVFDLLEIDEMKFIDVSLLHGMLCAHPLREFATLDAIATSGVDFSENPQTTPGVAHGTRDMEAEHVLAWQRREMSVQRLGQQYGMTERQRRQALRVSASVAHLYHQATNWWQKPVEATSIRREHNSLAAQTAFSDTDTSHWLGLPLLLWAAQLHEIGMRVNARHYHRHGSYLIQHSDMPGFSEAQRHALALLIRGHRRGLPGLAFRALDSTHGGRLLRLLSLLRLAVILERSHNDADSPRPSLSVDGSNIILEVGSAWLDAHPLSSRELEFEVAQLRGVGFLLEFS